MLDLAPLDPFGTTRISGKGKEKGGWKKRGVQGAKSLLFLTLTTCIGVEERRGKEGKKERKVKKEEGDGGGGGGGNKDRKK